MTAFPVKALDATTWPDFARLVDKHNGVWGGCWCMSFQPRITCFFVDRGYRRRGVAAAALQGALREIARLGGGTVETYPETVDSRSVSGSFLHNATASLFERHGFERGRPLGKHHLVMTKVVR